MKNNAMSDLLFQCKGITLDVLSIPPFDIYESEAVCLHLPPDNIKEYTDKVIPLLVGGVNSEYINVYGKIKHVSVNQYAKKCFMPSRKNTVENIIQERLGNVSEEAIAFLQSCNISPDIPYDNFGGTERLLLGLFIELHFSDIIVFTTGGIDPLGCEKIRDFVSLNIKGKGVLHFSFSPKGNGNICLGNKCYEASLCS